MVELIQCYCLIGNITVKTRPLEAESFPSSKCVWANLSYYLDCQHQAIHATRHCRGHAFFIRLYMYFNEQGWWGVPHRHEGKPSTLPLVQRLAHNLSVNHSKASNCLSLAVSSHINHTEIFAYFRGIIKRRLQRGADDQSANQRTRLHPNSDSVSQMAN